MSIPEVDNREELSEGEIKQRIDNFNRGDRILFNERKEPLKVTKINIEGKVSLGENLSGVEVKGRTARYILSPDEAMYHRQHGIVRRSLSWVKKVN